MANGFELSQNSDVAVSLGVMLVHSLETVGTSVGVVMAKALLLEKLPQYKFAPAHFLHFCT